MGKTQEIFTDNDFCFACGMKNPLGLQLSFFLDGGLFCTLVRPKQHWQGFVGVVHGGLQATILDDLMSNHLFRVEGAWVATAELSLRFRRPVPLNRELLFTSRVVSHEGRIWTMNGACRFSDDKHDTPALTTAHCRLIEIPPPDSE